MLSENRENSIRPNEDRARDGKRQIARIQPDISCMWWRLVTSICHLRFTSTLCFPFHLFILSAAAKLIEMPVRAHSWFAFISLLCVHCALYDYYYEYIHEFDRCFDRFQFFFLCRVSHFLLSPPLLRVFVPRIFRLWHAVRLLYAQTEWDHKQW